MADEAILTEARELQARCERADADVRRELVLMSASVASANATVRTIAATHEATRRHADGMARELAADLRDTAAVLSSSGEGDQMASETLQTAMRDVRSPLAAPPSQTRSFTVPPPPRDHSIADEIRAYRLPAPSPAWVPLANVPDLAEEVARAAADAIAAQAAATPEAERRPAERREEKETA